MDRAADPALDVRDIDPAAGGDHDGAQVEQRNCGAATNTEHALLDPEQTFVAVEHQSAAQRTEQDAGGEREDPESVRPQRADRNQPTTTSGDAPAGPRGRAREV